MTDQIIETTDVDTETEVVVDPKQVAVIAGVALVGITATVLVRKVVKNFRSKYRVQIVKIDQEES